MKMLENMSIPSVQHFLVFFEFYLLTSQFLIEMMTINSTIVQTLENNFACQGCWKASAAITVNQHRILYYRLVFVRSQEKICIFLKFI